MCARSAGYAQLKHPSDRSSAPRRLGAIAIHEILALKSHPVLNGDTAAECFHACDVAIRDRLAVVEEPVKTVKWDLATHFFVHVQSARDSLFVGRVQSEGPPILSDVPNHGL